MDANLNINIDSEGNVINMGNRFIPNLRAAIKGNSASITPEQAAMAAAGKLKLKVQQPIKVKERRAPDAKVTAAAKPVVLTDGGISLAPIPAKLVYQPMPDGSVRLAWEVGIYETDAQHYWNTKVDAATGDVLLQEDLVIDDIWGPEVATDAPATEKKPFKTANRKPAASKQEQLKARQQLYTQLFAQKTVAAKAAITTVATSGTYRVYDAPFETTSHGDRTLLTGKENAAASPLGWHNDGTVSYTITKGNNVHAYEDRAGANAGVSPMVALTLSLTFHLI